jgi:hypothetical protein
MLDPGKNLQLLTVGLFIKTLCKEEMLFRQRNASALLHHFVIFAAIDIGQSASDDHG